MDTVDYVNIILVIVLVLWALALAFLGVYNPNNQCTKYFQYTTLGVAPLVGLSISLIIARDHISADESN